MWIPPSQEILRAIFIWRRYFTDSGKKALNFVEMLNICIFVLHLEVIQHWKNFDVVFEDEGLTILVFLEVFMGHPIFRVGSIFYTTYYYI